MVEKIGERQMVEQINEWFSEANKWRNKWEKQRREMIKRKDKWYKGD